ncbi:hypothetical protein IEQ34_017415 [Dendrobium chrysotoxum]|uniref:Uncharacterized protein n=1 Tax=Dendrobium chrysotoxum TaxID=161865 RepID=A0AAV7G9E8_DENCH|nr:hypothetical protein IEQ34_017415 [Dendrobium chrysotoxum]
MAASLTRKRNNGLHTFNNTFAQEYLVLNWNTAEDDGFDGNAWPKPKKHTPLKAFACCSLTFFRRPFAHFIESKVHTDT